MVSHPSDNPELAERLRRALANNPDPNADTIVVPGSLWDTENPTGPTVYAETNSEALARKDSAEAARLTRLAEGIERVVRLHGVTPKNPDDIARLAKAMVNEVMQIPPPEKPSLTIPDGIRQQHDQIVAQARTLRDWALIWQNSPLQKDGGSATVGSLGMMALVLIPSLLATVEQLRAELEYRTIALQAEQEDNDMARAKLTDAERRLAELQGDYDDRERDLKDLRASYQRAQAHNELLVAEMRNTKVIYVHDEEKGI